MEPISDWLEDSLSQVPPKEVRIGAARVRLTTRRSQEPVNAVDHTWMHPDEDCFEVPHMVGDELTTAPPVRLLKPEDNAMPPEGTAEEVKALHTFLNVATAAERLGGDNVTLPHHYARFNIEPVRFICENNLNFFQANIVKYVLRWDAKNGLEDLNKAKRYLEMFIRFVQKDPDWWR